jgi:hypothetical protein
MIKKRREKGEERREMGALFSPSLLLTFLILQTKSIGEFNQKHVVWFDTEQVS